MTLPYNPRMVFAAVAGFTERVTKDGRVLTTPEDFHVRPGRTNGYPLPVLWTPPAHPVPVPTMQVGTIGEAYVVDHRLILFGHIDMTEYGRQASELLASGWFLEIDIDSGDMTYHLDPLLPDLEQIPVGPVTFKNWTLRAAWVGSNPCWDLPPVQIQEITR